MYSTLNGSRAALFSASFSRHFSTTKSVNLLKLDSKVHKIFSRNKFITREEFLKMRKINLKSKSIPTEKEKISFLGYSLLVVPISTFILGTWQVKRLKWKLDLINQLEDRMSRPAVPLPENLNDLKDMEYCHVKVKGHFIHEKEFTVGPRTLVTKGSSTSENTAGLFSSSDMARGYTVITPFKLADRDLTILVNRGWVPRAEKNPNKRQQGQVEGTIELTGVVRLQENRPQFVKPNIPEDGVWLYRDVNAMAKMTESAPIYIDATFDSTVPNGPIGGQTRVNLRNQHLSYLITWYCLSGLTSWMWFRQNIQRLPLL